MNFNFNDVFLGLILIGVAIGVVIVLGIYGIFELFQHIDIVWKG